MADLIKKVFDMMFGFGLLAFYFTATYSTCCCPHLDNMKRFL
jgi:hypothetical protein